MKYKEIVVKNSTPFRNVLASSALMLGVLSPAHAVVFTYDGYGGFVPGTQQMSPPATATFQGYALGTGERGQVSWGTPTGAEGPFGGQSGLEINSNNPNLFVGQSISLGQSVNFGYLTHYNEPITQAGGDLNSVKVGYYLRIYADSVLVYSMDFTGSNAFGLNVWETSNTQPCPNSAPAGTALSHNGNTHTSNGNPQSTCDDAFSFGPTSGSSQFSYLGHLYDISFAGFFDQSAPGGSFTPGGTFWSSEEGTDRGYVQLRLNQVPEPGTMALLGLSLLGLRIVQQLRRPVSHLPGPSRLA